MPDSEIVKDQLQKIVDELARLSVSSNRIEVKACLARAEYLRDCLLFQQRADLVSGFDQAISAALCETASGVGEYTLRVADATARFPETPEEGPRIQPKGGSKRGFSLPVGFIPASSVVGPTVTKEVAMMSPKVFIQYAQVDDAYCDKALVLANRLRDDGIETMIDSYEPHPPKGWPEWMTHNLRVSDYVLVLCSPENLIRFNKDAGAGVGQGATWEGHLIQQHLYDGAGINAKFIPVILRPDDRDHIPEVLKSVTHYKLFESTGYERLLRRITNQPEVVMPPVGSIKKLPPRKV